MYVESYDKLENLFLECINSIDITNYDFYNSKELNKSEYGSCGKRGQLKFFFDRKCGDFSVEFIHHLTKDELTIRVIYTDSQDEDDDFDKLYGPVKIPRTEEEYFQYYTIQDNVFSLNFYNTLDEKMSLLLRKWNKLD